ncbi:Floral homeotic protein GLOBOSA [Capsicum annuum]|nr:Floral homeotic protein GLOBOSA [Capsicum annuum]
MGRGKIEIKRIENSNNRQVTYSKRRNGIIKKAREITVLCDAKVSLIIFGTSGKMHEYCSPSTTMSDILDGYQKASGRRLWDAKHENLSNEIDRIKKENDSMQVKLRHLKGEDINSLNHKELMVMEEALENGLSSISAKQDQILEEEHKQLQYALHQKEMAAMGGNMRGIHEEAMYHQREREDYEYQQMPFALRVQPMQPNLHERM